jgi:hypothetical protein
MPCTADLDLWLATTVPGFCLITARQEAINDGTVSLRLPVVRGAPRTTRPETTGMGKGGLLRLVGLKTAAVYVRRVNIRECSVLGLAQSVVN